MPIRRFPKRRFTRKRRPVNRFRKRIHNRIRRPIRSPIYNYKQTVELPNITVPASTNAFFFARSFSLLDIIDNASPLVQLYDNYRIMAIKLTIYPQYNTYNANVATVSIPEIFTVVDFNDDTAPTNVQELYSYQNLKRRQAIRPHQRYFKPRARITGISDGGTNTATMLVNHNAWMNSTNTNINYFAIKGAVSFGSTTNTIAQSYRVVCTYYVQFKNVK